MRFRTSVELGFIFLTSCMVHSQSDSLVDVMPLSVGNRWSYRYYASVFDNSDVTVTDSGLAVYYIVATIPEQDSTRWIFIERRNLRHCIDYYFNQQLDTCWSIIDSSTFEIIEAQSGHHRLYRNEPEETIWHSVFPWSSKLTDTTVIYRHSHVDSAEIAAFETHPVTPPFSWVYDFSFQRGIGQTVVTSHTSKYVVGVIYNSTHILEGSLINSVPDYPEIHHPSLLTLDQNYPNPFNSSTSIAYRTSIVSHIRLRVFNVLGQKVATLFDGMVSPGYHTFNWDASHLASGVYLYRLDTEGFTQSRRALLLR